MIHVEIETTPNPQSMKFKISEKIASESIHFSNINETQRSPLARKLFGFPWAESIFLGEDFVTVTKQDWVEWEIIASPLAQLIQEHIENKEPVLVDLEQLEIENSTLFNESDSPTVRAIKTIIHNEIRPAVAMDGGDIEFVKYENNKVYIHMLGACSGCPSATLTLKQGVETRIKNAIPEVQEVISLN